MKGQIAISKTEVENNKIGWNVFDFFKEALSQFTKSHSAGWYAYILRDNIYYFLWCDLNEKASGRYLELLKKDGYIIAYP